MDCEPNLVVSGMSQRVVEDGIPFKVEIHKLEGDPQWTLEVVTRDGSSFVWDDQFDDAGEAFVEAISAIREEGPQAFERGGSNVIPLKL